MSLWTFLTIVIVVSVLAGTFGEYHKRKANVAGEEKKLNKTIDRVTALEASISRTEKRIQTLETFIVDNNMGYPETESRSDDDHHRPLKNKLRTEN